MIDPTGSPSLEHVMLGRTEFEVRQRHLIVIATGRYDDESWDPLDVDSEVSVWVDWLTHVKLTDRRFTQIGQELSQDPSVTEITSFFLDAAARIIRPNDAVVLIVTGHGYESDRVHRLVLKSSNRERPSVSMQRTDQIIGWLKDTNIEHALVIIDTCHSGRVAESVLNFDRTLPPGWVGIATAAPNGQARFGAVTDGVIRFLASVWEDDRFGSDLEEYLNPRDLLDVIASGLPHGQVLTPFSGRYLTRSKSPCLPNPKYGPTKQDRVSTAPSRHALAIRRGDLESHWSPKSRGVQRDDEPGWFFSGRKVAMRAILSAARGPSGVYVVTGTAGCGKSALLSRLVTLCDPTFRADYKQLIDRIPEEVQPRLGDVDVALLANGQASTELLSQLCSGLGAYPEADDNLSPSEAMRAQRAALYKSAGNRKVTIVIDALDESPDPWSVLSDVLVPLARKWPEPGIRMIIGVRSAEDTGRWDQFNTLAGSTIRALAAHELRVDRGEYWSGEDLAMYVTQILLRGFPDGSPTPYEGRPLEAEPVGQAISELVGSSFVVAQIAAHALTAKEAVQDPSDPEWQRSVRAGLSSVFSAELYSGLSTGSSRERVIDVLTAAAIAGGRGIPWRRVWPRVASALSLSRREYDDADIQAVVAGRLGGYLSRDLENDQTVYRPFHDSLSRALRSGDIRYDQATPPGDSAYFVGDSETDLESSRHSAVLDSLWPMVRLSIDPANFSDPEPYIRSHLAWHASEAGRLDELVLDAAFLVQADPDRLLEQLGKVKKAEGRWVRDIYRSVFAQLRGRSPLICASIIEIRASLEQNKGLVRAIDRAAASRPWLTLWAQGRPIGAGHVAVNGHAGGVSALNVVSTDSGSAIISGGADRSLRFSLWENGRQTRVIHGHDAGITCLTEGRTASGMRVLVTGDSVGTVRMFDIETGDAVGVAVRCHTGMITGLALCQVLDEQMDVVISTSSYDSCVRFLDLRNGVEAFRPHYAYRGGLGSLAVVPRAGDGWRIFAGEVHVTNGRMVAWDFDADGAVRDAFRESAPGIRSLSTWGDGDEALVVSGHVDGTVRIWSASGSKPVSSFQAHRDCVSAVSVGPLVRGEQIVASGDTKGIVEIWKVGDVWTRDAQFVAHNGSVDALSIVVHLGGTAVVSGGADGAVRMWNLDEIHSVGSMTFGSDAEAAGLAEDLAVSSRPDFGAEVYSSARAARILRINGLQVVLDSRGRAWDLKAGGLVRDYGFASELLVVERLQKGLTALIAQDHEVHAVKLDSTGDFMPSEPVFTSLTGNVTAIAARDLSPTRSVIAYGNEDGRVSLRSWWWDEVRSLAPIVDSFSLSGHYGRVTELAIAKLDGGHGVAVTGDLSGTVRVWNLNDRHGVPSILRAHEGAVRRMVLVGARGEADRILLTSGDDGTVRSWDLRSLRGLGEPFALHEGAVEALAVESLSQGPVVLSGDSGGRVRLWDLRSRKEVVEFVSFGSPVLDVSLSFGSWSVSSSDGLTVGNLMADTLVGDGAWLGR